MEPIVEGQDFKLIGLKQGTNAAIVVDMWGASPNSRSLTGSGSGGRWPPAMKKRAIFTPHSLNAGTTSGDTDRA
jgi:hypothetical protein